MRREASAPAGLRLVDGQRGGAGEVEDAQVVQRVHRPLRRGLPEEVQRVALVAFHVVAVHVHVPQAVVRRGVAALYGALEQCEGLRGAQSVESSQWVFEAMTPQPDSEYMYVERLPKAAKEGDPGQDASGLHC